MYLHKAFCVALTLTAVAVAEPAPQYPSQNQYLPPDKGYRYVTPKVPFPTPTYRPTTSITYRPPTTTHTSGGTILPVFRPTTLPPVTYPTPVTVPSTYRPPVTQRPYTPPVEHHDHHHEPGMPFDFEYAVRDELHGADYGHKANSNGDVVQGEYRIALPDGRIQLVRYTADWATGFHAEVSYQGEARYGPNRPADAYGAPQQ